MFQTCLSLVQDPAYPGQNGPNDIKRILEVIVITRGRKDAHDHRPDTAVTHDVPEFSPSAAHLPVLQDRWKIDSRRQVGLSSHQEDRVSAQVCEAQEKCDATRGVVFCKQIPGCRRKQC